MGPLRRTARFRLILSSSVLPFWAWAGLLDRPIAMLVLQHAQILIDVYYPAHSPIALWRRRKHQRAAASEGTNRTGTRQSLPGARWEDSESKRDLISARSGKA